jgi:hypothetical protein
VPQGRRRRGVRPHFDELDELDEEDGMKLLLWLSTALAAPSALEGLLAGWRAAGAQPPDPARGQALWSRSVPAPDGGPARSCTSCHGPQPASPGRHTTTGEPIAPMTDPERFSDPATVEKWFGRNCRWTLGRDCTPTEKADVTAWLTSQRRTP